MEIKNYVKSSDIPQKYLKSLVKSEIECWWSAPFDEFMICNDHNCWTIYSIEDVYWSIENYRNRKEDKEFRCECGCETEQFYKPEEFIKSVKDYIKWEVSSVLILIEEDVEGFGVISNTTLWELINMEFATRPSSYDKNILLNELSKKIFWLENAEEKEVVILHQIFISEFIRWRGNWKKLLNNLLTINPNKNLPFILETRYDSQFYSISRSMWFENIINDKFWYVVQYNNKKSFISLNNFNEYLNQISIKFEFYKKEALDVLNSNIGYLSKKKYS